MPLRGDFCGMSFKGMGKIYPKRMGDCPEDHRPSHLLDEFPSWLFLGEVLSSRARFRFTSRDEYVRIR
jgi:hypothetical protein